MMKSVPCKLLVLLFLMPLLAFSKNNQPDLNQQYIDEMICKFKSKIKNIDDCNFIDGYIIKNRDTIDCKIFRKTRKSNLDSYLFVMVKVNNDSIQFFTSQQIDGYSVKNEVYKKHISSDGNSFFIKRIKTGKATMYERESIPSDLKFVYYLTFKSDNKFYYFAPFVSKS